jgi:hypothetical protein
MVIIGRMPRDQRVDERGVARAPHVDLVASAPRAHSS